ncbi:MAG: regulatory protein RecX [Arcanobacterium sp.]|nr:regulatory protein RecX [Arcanobacterium sp.]
MVDYSEAAYSRRRKRKSTLSPAERRERQEARDAARTPEEWERIARDSIYRQLAISDRSEHQILMTLKRRRVPEEIAARMIQKFVAAGLVDDEKFAFSYVKNISMGKAVSRRKLIMDLRKKGISESIAQEAALLLDDDQEQIAATEFALQKISRMQSLESEVIYRRLYGALARRGYGSGVIKVALSAAFSELEKSSDLNEEFSGRLY